MVSTMEKRLKQVIWWIYLCFWRSWDYICFVLDELYTWLSVSLGNKNSRPASSNEIKMRDDLCRDGWIKFQINNKSYLSQMSRTVEALAPEAFVSQSDLLISRPARFFLRLFVRCTPLPSTLFEGYSFVRDPVGCIDGLATFIRAEIIPFAETLTESHVSIENVQLYRTNTRGDLVNEKFHRDGDIRKSIKIIIYLSDCGSNDGPLEVLANGVISECTADFGTAIAFAASRFEHRGSRPVSRPRWALNLKVYPAITSSRIERLGSRYLDATRRRFLFIPMNSFLPLE
jgi:hypothetical protein